MSDETKTILVVEDEDFLRDGIIGLLEFAGWQATGARDGAAALEIFRRIPFEMVMTDLLMPNMDGFQLLRHLREIDPDLPVVVLTGYGTLERCADALRAGATDFVHKPFEEEVLFRTLEKAWRSRLRSPLDENLLARTWCDFSITMPADAEQIAAAVAEIEALSRTLGFFSRRWAVRRAVEEALSNAIYHGAKNDATRDVLVAVSSDGERMTIKVSDSGRGFSPKPERHDDGLGAGSGRGVDLLRGFCDEVRWIPPGNTVELVFVRRHRDPRR